MESTCFCGVAMTGGDIDALVAVGVDHFGSIHAELGLTEIQIRNFFEGEQRIDGPVDRLDAIGEIEVRPISGETRDDILEFFDRRAFADNTAWGMCYCMYHHIGGDQTGPWPDRTWQENRSDLSIRVDTESTTGVVAYVDGVVAGFCNASARDQYPDKSGESDRGVGSIVCFVVAPPFRGHGVQRALLAGAVEMLANRGFEYAEAYPIRTAENTSSAFVGTLRLFENHGFDVVSEEPLRVRRAI